MRTAGIRYPYAIATALLLSACGGMPKDDTAADTSRNSLGPVAATAFAWPISLAPFGDGYPAKGDHCRRVGESVATSDYLDDSAILVGCPGQPADPAAIAILSASRGRVVGEVGGVTLISVPMGDANQGMTTNTTPGG